MTAIHRNSRPFRTKDVVHQTMPPDTILLNLENGYYYSTNPVGAEVWSLCDGSLTVADIARQVSGTFNAPIEQVETDVLELLEDMAKEGLIDSKHEPL